MRYPLFEDSFELYGRGPEFRRGHCPRGRCRDGLGPYRGSGYGFYGFDRGGFGGRDCDWRDPRCRWRR